MQVFLNDLCLQAQDLHKLEDYVNALSLKGVKHIYYAHNIENIITKTLLDENELSIWINSFEKIQSKVQVFSTIHEENINYFVPILNNQQLQEIDKNTAVAHAVRKSLEYPKEIIALLHLSNCQMAEYGYCHVLRQDTIKQEITLIKLPIMDSPQKINLLLGLDFIKKERADFEEIAQTTAYKEVITQALKFDFSYFTYKQTDLLPLKNFSNYLIPTPHKDWEEWGKEIKRLGKEAVNAKNMEIGAKVASINGYVFSEKITKCNETPNSKREIYEAGKDRNKVYLSIEFEKPFTFEAFNFNGEHIGELNFDGHLRPQKKHKLKINC